MTTTHDHRTDDLADGFTGEILRPGDAGYDDARQVYNGMFDRRPALIARCRTTDDVVRAVRFARDRDLLVAVRGGGHSIAGFSVCDDGIVIDLSLMKHIDVDPDARVARAQPGVLLGELDAATQVHGLATPLGFVSVTGIAGLTLNGGIGWLSRKHGLSCDNLLAAEVVLADGSVVQASDDENADLMWGLRGGGGNFGIVTRFEYRLHEISDVYLQMRFFDAAQMAEVLRAWAAATTSLSDDALAYATTLTVPENEMFPPELHNRFVAAVFLGHLGGEPAALEELAAFDGLPEPLLQMGMTMPFQEAQTMQDEDVPPGRRNYWKMGNLTELTDEAIDTIATHATSATSPYCSTGLLLLGGAVSRVGETDTAFTGRDARFQLTMDNIWEDAAEDEDQIAWTRSFHQAVQPYLSDGAYLNFTSGDTADEVRQAYGPNYPRLVELKDRYDPTNLFRLNQNIQPSS